LSMGNISRPQRRRILSCIALSSLLLSSAACRRHVEPPPRTTPWKLQLNIRPEHPHMTKSITFFVHIDDAQGHAINNAKVSGTLTMSSMEMEKAVLKFGVKGNGDYGAWVKDMDMAGRWNLAIEAVQGNTHETKDFEVTVLE
jgi:YtkA-like protein